MMRGVEKGPTKFTTQACIDWAKRRGWKMVDRERWDALNRRHHDLQLAVDALFDDGRGGLVGIQGAGKGERAAHRRKFEKAGGEATAKRRGIRVLYMEFVRGNPTPISIERWS